MKKRLQGLVAGILIGATLSGGAAIAGNLTTLYDVMAGGIKIVVDGNEIVPTDANGNIVEPMIYNGTTYLPVRAVGNAFGKAVYWDGPSYTVYLGDMDGVLEYPTLELRDAEQVRGNNIIESSNLTDNYGTRYRYANTFEGGSSLVDNSSAEYLLNMQYSRFKATLYVTEGARALSDNSYISIIADGRTIYTSPALSYSSRPIEIDVDVTGCNQFVIEYSVNRTENRYVCLGNAGFYQ